VDRTADARAPGCGDEQSIHGASLELRCHHYKIRNV
jgi:hypothetical protein